MIYDVFHLFHQPLTTTGWMEPRVLVLFWPTLKWQLSSRCPRLSLFFSNPNNVKSPPPAVETLHSSFSERADVRSDIWESTLSGELHRKRKTMECVYIYILFFFTTGKWVHSSRLHITGKKKGNQEQNMRGGLKESIEWSAPFFYGYDPASVSLQRWDDVSGYSCSRGGSK